MGKEKKHLKENDNLERAIRERLFCQEILILRSQKWEETSRMKSLGKKNEPYI